MESFTCDTISAADTSTNRHPYFSANFLPSLSGTCRMCSRSFLLAIMSTGGLGWSPPQAAVTASTALTATLKDSLEVMLYTTSHASAHATVSRGTTTSSKFEDRSSISRSILQPSTGIVARYIISVSDWYSPMKRLVRYRTVRAVLPTALLPITATLA